MGIFDKLPGIDEENTTRRNLLVGGGYGFVGLAILGNLGGGEDDEPTNGSADADTDTETETESEPADDEPEESGVEIAFEDDWFGAVTEEHNPETFDPNEDLDTVIAWVDDTVEFLEFVFLELDVDDLDAWNDAGETADELDERFIDEGIEGMFSREVDDNEDIDSPFVADGMPAWDFDFAAAVDGQNGLYGAVLDVSTAALQVEEEGPEAESFIVSAAESIALALISLEEADRYEYDAPDLAEEFE